jgi:hypothetical protein
MPKLEANLYPRGTVLVGLRGSGKTNAARYIASLHPDNVLVYDPLGQYTEYDTLRPKHIEFPEAADELARLIKQERLAETDRHPYRLLVIDEAARVAPSSQKLHPAIARLNAEHRHWPMGIVWIVQRPRQLHHNIINLADYLFVWRLPGATDASFLEDTARGLSQAADGLQDYGYVFVNQDRRYYAMPPMPDTGVGK